MNEPAGSPVRPIYSSRVTWNEVDPAGIVWHVHIAAWAEKAFHTMLFEAGMDPRQLPVELVIQRLQVDFRSPLRLYERFHVRTWLTDVGPRSFVERFSVSEAEDRAGPDRTTADGPAGGAERLCAEGSRLRRYVDRTTFRATECPPALLTRLQELAAGRGQGGGVQAADAGPGGAG